MPHRYFTDDIKEQTAVLHGADAKHLSVVMRAKQGEEIIICDGNGIDYQCTVKEISADCIKAEIISKYECVSEPNLSVTIYTGYPKGDKLEHIIQKSVELGAVRIVPFFSQFCTVKPKKEEQKNIRYNRIAQEAAKQSGRGILPVVSMPLSYKEMLQEASQSEAAFFCYEAGGAALLSRLEGVTNTIAIITGSEGGFSLQEAVEANKVGCIPIGLGPRILRCETAPLAALSVVMALTGNLQ